MVPLFIQNTAVVISAAFLAWIVSAENAPLPAWGLFTIVTFFSSIAVLASVEFQFIFTAGCGLAGIAIAYDKMIGCVVIGGINIIAMIVQAIMVWKVYHLVPDLRWAS